MTANVVTLIVSLAAAGFALMGLVALLRPDRIVGYFGMTATTADLRNEIRAVYGGFGLAIGGLLMLSAGMPAYAGGVRLAVATALLGMAAGRVVGFCAERAGRWPWIFGAVEVVVGGALLAASA